MLPIMVAATILAAFQSTPTNAPAPLERPGAGRTCKEVRHVEAYLPARPLQPPALRIGLVLDALVASPQWAEHGCTAEANARNSHRTLLAKGRQAWSTAIELSRSRSVLDLAGCARSWLWDARAYARQDQESTSLCLRTISRTSAGRPRTRPSMSDSLLRQSGTSRASDAYGELSTRHCGSNHSCIIAVAKWICRHWHSARHCRIWHRWQHKLWLAKHPPASAPPAPATTVSSSSTAASSLSSSDLADVPGVPHSFAACVAFRESTDGQLSSNIYGIQGPGGWGTLAQQKEAFSQMYAARGTEPWHQWDGC